MNSDELSHVASGVPGQTGSVCDVELEARPARPVTPSDHSGDMQQWPQIIPVEHSDSRLTDHSGSSPESTPANPPIEQSINSTAADLEIDQYLNPSPVPPIANQNPKTENSPTLGEYRGNGFVARLPKILRDQVNQMILDGVSNPEIIRRLGEPGKHLKPDHLYQWKLRGYKDWLLQQDWLAERRARRESAADLIQDCDTTQTNESALHLGTLYVFEALRDLRSGSLDDKLGGDSASFARLLNALSRASRETLTLQKYREACAKARQALKPLRDPNRKLSERERRALVLRVDELLGIPSGDDIGFPPPAALAETSGSGDSSAQAVTA
jgi:hypothetical protein